MPKLTIVKDGKKLASDPKDSSKKELQNPTADLPNITLDIELNFPNSLNEELEEHLKKDKKRFFGGCGG